MVIERYFFLFLIATMCCDHSSEPCQRDGSVDGSQHRVLSRINKSYLLIITKYSLSRAQTCTYMPVHGIIKVANDENKVLTKRKKKMKYQTQAC